MSGPIPIEALMTRAPETIGPDATVLAARRMMVERGIRHLPVVEEGRVVGVLSHRDMRLLMGGSGVSLETTTPVRDVAVGDPYQVEVGTPATEVLAALAKRQIGSVLITRSGALVGIFTSMDACRVLADYLSQSESARE